MLRTDLIFLHDRVRSIFSFNDFSKKDMPCFHSFISFALGNDNVEIFLLMSFHEVYQVAQTRIPLAS